MLISLTPKLGLTLTALFLAPSLLMAAPKGRSADLSFLWAPNK